MKNIHYILLAVLVTACSGTGTGTQEVKAPGVPVGIKLTASDESSLTLQWSAVEGATEYNWKLLKETTSAKSGTVTSSNVKISDLEKGTTYMFYVRAKNTAGGSVWSSAFEAKTAGEGGGGGGGGGGGVDPAKYPEFQIPAHDDESKTALAFPGAQGGGMYATGGRGGYVYHVTSLEDSSSEGTLRYGIEKGKRPLTIVFDVAGVIPLKSQLNIKSGDLTIAGQSAPGDGICLKNYTFRISASNVIVRFIRCRMGDELKTEDDAIQVMSHDDDKYENIIIDHCSVSWCTDECASFYGMKNFTFSWNMVTESLRVSVHGKGNHGYGGIWGGNNASYHHNLLAHHDSRNPRLDHDYVSTQHGPVSIVNNVVYNWSGNSCYGGESSIGDDYRKYNFVGNYYKPGPATPSNHIWFLDPTTSCSNCTGLSGAGSVKPGHFYMTGNYMYGKSAMSADNWTGLSKNSLASSIKEENPYDGFEVCLHSAEDALEAVVAYAGASYARDEIDARIAQETKNGTYTYTGSKGGTKGLIDTQTDVGGWPAYTFSTEDEKLYDSDADGMPNWFEEAYGLNKGVDDSQKINLDVNGRYTNLEMYLHYLVKDIVIGSLDKGEYKYL